MQTNNSQKKRSRPCPDCGSPLIRRTSSHLTLLLTRTLLICKNPICGASFAGFDEITHRVSPPSQRNPEIKLPTVPGKDRKEIFNSITNKSQAS